MNSRRTTHAIALACLLSACGAIAPAVASAQAAGSYEAPPLLAGSALAPAALLKGPLHTVAEPVALEGFFGRFVIE